jgi:UTP:GlnB (protein PII) uridylyltransferase
MEIDKKILKKMDFCSYPSAHLIDFLSQPPAAQADFLGLKDGGVWGRIISQFKRKKGLSVM